MVSSLKLHAGTRRGEDGRASETRRCFKVAWEPLVAVGGYGAAKEKVELDGALICAVGSAG